MKYIIIVLLGLIGANQSVYAFDDECCNAWFMSGAFGMNTYQDLGNNQDKRAVGRLGLGKTIYTDTYIKLSLEAGIQSGASQRLTFSKDDIDALGGVPIETQIQPMLDVLFGIKTETFNEVPIFSFIKGGVAYRQMQTDRDDVNNLSLYSPEIQAGFGYRVNEKASITLNYQYVWGEKPTLVVNPISETGILNNIPSQQAVMLGFSFNFQ